jgi:16S rRNA (uracil1498-N3)-methyltransferase
VPVPFVLLAPGALDDLAAGDRAALPAPTAHHLRRVLRLGDGDTVEVADGAGAEATGRLAGEHVLLTVTPRVAPEPHPAVEVLQGFGKGRKHDDVVRVLTELGVDRVTAVVGDRSVRDPGAKVDRLKQRWLAVAVAACGQARRPWLPVIDGPIEVAAAVPDLAGTPLLVADVAADTDPLEAVSALGSPDRIALAVGPEGGWSDAELATFRTAGAIFVSLGPTILRTEHAASILAAVALAATGRMGRQTAEPHDERER